MKTPGAGHERLIVVLPDASAVAREAAQRIAADSKRAIATRGVFTFGLAGGTTPRATYELLAARGDLDWSATEIFFGDERAVPPQHPDSNYRMAQEALLTPASIPLARVHRMQADEEDLQSAAHAYEATLRSSLGDPPRLDVLLLGLGADGHVASLFPHHPSLQETERFVVATQAPAIAPRLTITFPVVNAARRVLLLVTGSQKAEVLHRVLEGPSEPDVLPAQAIAPETAASVWLVDRDGASRCTRALQRGRATP